VTIKAKNIPSDQAAHRDKRHLNGAARRAYLAQKSPPLENKQITDLLPMVHNIVRRVVSYLKPPLSYEDLVSAGTVGLVKAARDYDRSHHAEFNTYAYIRIKGAVLDELRSLSTLPPGAAKQIQRAMEITRKTAEQTGTTPTDTELAEKLGISEDELYKTFELARVRNFLSIDETAHSSAAPLADFLACSKTGAPDSQLEKNELIEKLTQAICQLEQRQRQIIVLYYQRQLTMKQIAEVFNITEPRVSQLHASAIFNLSVKMRQWKIDS
jgi:RNA polymerase sigma factor for flagellar operon FliA